MGSVGSVRTFVTHAAPRLAPDILITVEEERVLILRWRRPATRESPRTAAGPIHSCAGHRCVPRNLLKHHFPLHKELGSFPDVPGRTHREDAFIAAGEKYPFQKSGTLIVEEVFVPFVLHKLRYDHDNAAGGMFF